MTDTHDHYRQHDPHPVNDEEPWRETMLMVLPAWIVGALAVVVVLWLMR